MKSQRVVYSLLVAAGLAAAVVVGLSIKYSPSAVLLSSALAVDAVYAKLFENTPEEDALYIEQAAARKDPALCGKVSARYVHSAMPRQTCYREVIMALADPAICRDEGVMEYIGEEHCYAAIAVATGDGSFCERTTGGNFGIRDGCYYDLALAKNDPGSCRKISDPETKSYCLKQCARKKKYDEDRVSGPAPLIPG